MLSILQQMRNAVGGKIDEAVKNGQLSEAYELTKQVCNPVVQSAWQTSIHSRRLAVYLQEARIAFNDRRYPDARTILEDIKEYAEWAKRAIPREVDCLQARLDDVEEERLYLLFVQQMALWENPQSTQELVMQEKLPYLAVTE